MGGVVGEVWRGEAEEGEVVAGKGGVVWVYIGGI